MLKITFSFSVVLLLQACGQSETAPRDSAKISFINSSYGVPILLEKSKAAECPSLKTGNLNGTVIIDLFSNWSYIQVPYRPAVRSKSGLVSYQSLSSVVTGGKFNFFESRISKRGVHVSEITKSNLYRSCPGRDYSEADTYESAASSALYSFSSVDEALNLINLKVEPIKLLIAPVIEHELEYQQDKNNIIRDRNILVNNAFYYGKRKEIIFLPQAKNENGVIPFGGIALWKIPFVGVHEYGHHIFANLMTNYYLDQSRIEQSQTDVFLCFDNRENVTKNDHIKDGAPRTINFDDIISSINEGFSDLFARVVVDKQFNFIGVGCLEYTRDVENSKFANGQAKRMNSKVYDKFFLNKHVKTTNCYRELNFQDPHIIGAILAHGLYSFYESNQFSKVQSLKAMTTWLKTINNRYSELRTMKLKDSFSEILFLGIETANKIKRIPKSETCRVVGQSFPMVRSYYSCK